MVCRIPYKWDFKIIKIAVILHQIRKPNKERR